MKTKFIGLEGFNEIESLSTAKRSARRRNLTTAQKTVRFIKRATSLCGKKIKYTAKEIFAKLSVKKAAKPQLSVLDRHYSENRRSEATEFSCSARDAVTGFSLKSSKVYAHSAPCAQRAHTVIKKKAILAVVACMSAIMLSCITVASALDMPEAKPATVKTSATVADEESTQSTLPVEENTLLAASTADEALGTIKKDAYSSIEKTIVAENSAIEIAGLYIDGTLIGATDDVNGLKDALYKFLVDYRKDYDEQTTTEFANNVEIKAVSLSDTVLLPAAELVGKADGKFSVSLSTDIVYTREVDFDVQTEYDDSQFSYFEEVKTEGAKGEELVTVRTTFVDGTQVDAVETEKKTIKKSVDKVVVKGSKDGIYEASSGSSTSFCWPLPYTHSISSYYEWRWGRMHNGLDIAAGGVYGQPIIAAASGTVTFSGDDGSGYGYYVTIDHGSGYTTLYGHCSSLAVSSGQHVSQGDVIGYVGSTGNSTGPHLHFEIRTNGNPNNPLDYVN